MSVERFSSHVIVHRKASTSLTCFKVKRVISSLQLIEKIASGAKQSFKTDHLQLIRFSRAVSQHGLSTLARWIELESIASFEDLQKAFKRCRLSLHPDKGGSTDDFVEAQRLMQKFEDNSALWESIPQSLFDEYWSRYKELEVDSHKLDLDVASWVLRFEQVHYPNTYRRRRRRR